MSFWGTPSRYQGNMYSRRRLEQSKRSAAGKGILKCKCLVAVAAPALLEREHDRDRSGIEASSSQAKDV